MNNALLHDLVATLTVMTAAFRRERDLSHAAYTDSAGNFESEEDRASIAEMDAVLEEADSTLARARDALQP